MLPWVIGWTFLMLMLIIYEYSWQHTEILFHKKQLYCELGAATCIYLALFYYCNFS